MLLKRKDICALMASWSIALDKYLAGDVWPIGVGEILRRIPDKVVVLSTGIYTSFAQA